VLRCTVGGMCLRWLRLAWGDSAPILPAVWLQPFGSHERWMATLQPLHAANVAYVYVSIIYNISYNIYFVYICVHLSAAGFAALAV